VQDKCKLIENKLEPLGGWQKRGKINKKKKVTAGQS